MKISGWLQTLIKIDVSKIIVENVKLLHIDKLKDKQTDTIPSIIQWNDTFVSLPTGYGKSVIYACVFKGSSLYKLTIGMM